MHGGLDHARNWDGVAKNLREHFHVYALDLRGHGNSAWAPGAMYSVMEHVLDLSALADIVKTPVSIVGHSLGAITTLMYAGVYPERVKQLVAIEGVGLPIYENQFTAADRARRWIEKVRNTENRNPHSYPDLAAAVARMKEANPFLSDEMAKHLAVYGTNWNADGSLIWKFDNFARLFPPYGADVDDAGEILKRITCPAQLFWGWQSFAKDPENDALGSLIEKRQIVKVDQAGHWLHHDQLETFLREARRFLLG